MLRARYSLHHALIPDFLAPRLVSLTTNPRSIGRKSHLHLDPMTGKITVPPNPRLTPPYPKFLREEAENGLLREFKRITKGEKAKQILISPYNCERICGYYLILGDEYIKQIDYINGPKYVSAYVETLLEACKIHVWYNHCDVLEQMAMFAATHGYTFGLEKIMVEYIKSTDPIHNTKVIDLYKRYRDTIGDDIQPTVGSMEEHEFNQVVDPHDGQTNERDIKNQSIGSIDLALLAIVGAATLDSFSSALEIALRNTHIRSLHFRTPRLLERLGTDPVVKKASDYIDSLKIIRMVNHPNILANYVTSITRDRNVDSMHRLQLSLSLGLAGPYPWIAPAKDAVSEERPVYMPEHIIMVFMTGLIQANLDHMAKTLWIDLQHAGLPPDILLYTALLDGYKERGEVDKVVKTWHSMEVNNIAPDAHAYCSKITAFFNAKLRDGALTSFFFFKRNREIIQKDVVVFNAVIHGLLTTGDMDAAKRVFAEISEHGIKPDTATYNTYLRHYAKKSDLKSVLRTLQELEATDNKPDAHTLSTVLSALLKAGKTDAAKRFVTIAREIGVEENVATYSAVIAHTLELRTRDSLNAAFTLLNQMEEKTTPNVIPYTNMLTAILRVPELSGAEILDMFGQIQKKMEVRGIKPNRVTYHIVIRAALENDTPEGLRIGLKTIKEMQDRGFKLTIDTWHIILYCLDKREDWELGYRMVLMMRKTLPEINDIPHATAQLSQKFAMLAGGETERSQDIEGVW